MREFKLFSRFLLVGAINTGFGYGVYSLLLFLGLSYALANLIALIVGILVSFQTQGRFVFRLSNRYVFFKFVACWAFIYCVNTLLIREIMSFGLGPYASGALALPSVIVLSYVGQRYWVFQDNNARALDAATKPDKRRSGT